MLTNTASVSFTSLSKYNLFDLKYSVKWDLVNVRTAGYLRDLTFPLRNR